MAPRPAPPTWAAAGLAARASRGLRASGGLGGARFLEDTPARESSPDLESWRLFFFFLWPPAFARGGGRRQVTGPPGAPSDRPAGLGVNRAVSGGRGGGGGGFAGFPDLGSSRGASPRPELGETFGPVPLLSSCFCWRGF